VRSLDNTIHKDSGYARYSWVRWEGAWGGALTHWGWHGGPCQLRLMGRPDSQYVCTNLLHRGAGNVHTVTRYALLPLSGVQGSVRRFCKGFTLCDRHLERCRVTVNIFANAVSWAFPRATTRPFFLQIFQRQRGRRQVKYFEQGKVLHLMLSNTIHMGGVCCLYLQS